jgi:4-diphosphocytidyl-2-C-methyl-D-erythritol kinase
MTRSARVRPLAKINLDLRVLGRRSDGFHELRTIFQTISLADSLELSFTPARKTTITLAEDNIPDNLVLRAAKATMSAMRTTGRVEMRLRKRIPMGAGLGGGSSDAAAVLLALPVLAGRKIAIEKLLPIAQELGSDVPFFLLGGAAAGIGRGTELFPLSDSPSAPGVLVCPNIHVSTAEAYRVLSAGLTTGLQENKMFAFQSHMLGWGSRRPGTNDFEAVVFRQHGRLAGLRRRLLQAGAVSAMMTGSGSAIFGLFPTAADASLAAGSLAEPELVSRVFRFQLVNRARYRSLWWRALREHIGATVWPPQSRYLR